MPHIKEGGRFFSLKYKGYKKGREEETTPCMHITHAKFEFYQEYKSIALASQRHKLKRLICIELITIFNSLCNKGPSPRCQQTVLVSTVHSSPNVTSV